MPYCTEAYSTGNRHLLLSLNSEDTACTGPEGLLALENDRASRGNITQVMLCYLENWVSPHTDAELSC